MAKSWKVSEDLKTWTFELQEQVAWVTCNEDTGAVEEVTDEDGNVRYVTAYDFLTGILYGLASNDYTASDYYLEGIAGVPDYGSGEVDLEDVDIETPSDYELVIHLKESTPYLDAIAELPVFFAYPTWIQGTTYGEFFRYGYGPYVISEPVISMDGIGFDTDDGYLTLVSNPFWEGSQGVDKPVLEEVTFDLDPDQDILKEFSEGNLDAVQLTFDEYKEAKNNPELADFIQITPGACGYYLFFKHIDNKKAISLSARKMIAAAIDRDKMNEVVFLDSAQVLTQFIPADVRGSQPDSVGIAYDPDRAKDYFSELAIYGNTNESLNLLSIEGDMNDQVAELVLSSLDDAKIPAYWDSLTWEEFFSNDAIESHYGEIVLTEVCMDYYDAQSLWDVWSSANFVAQDEPWHWVAFQENLQKSLHEKDTDDRIEAYASLEQSVLQDDAVVIPLIWGSNYWLVNPALDANLLPFYQQLETWAVVE